jgi:PEGA domain
MRRATSVFGSVLLLAALCAGGLTPADAAGSGRAFAAAASYVRFNATPVVRSYGYPSFGNYGYSSPFVSVPSLSPPYPYMRKYWWTGSYPEADPRQAGYNPSAGYNWQEVTTLILATSPAKADVTLDGSAIGSADDLGPIQLPMGDHTLRVEAPGYEPSETKISVRTPSVQRMQINLKSSQPVAASMPPR